MIEHENFKLWKQWLGDAIRASKHSLVAMRVDSKSLDGLRGIAAFHVALGHCFWFATNTEFMGECAIVVFFLVSGFVMVVGYGQKRYCDNGGVPVESLCLQLDRVGLCSGKTTSETHDNSNGVTFPTYDFLLKRFARLGPMYYISSLLAIPLCFLVHVDTTFLIYDSILTLFLLTSWGGQFPVNYPLWTISTMAFFYVCFPSLMLRLQNLTTAEELRRLAWRMYALQVFIAVLFVALFVCIQEYEAWYIFWRMFPPNRLPVFVMGMCLGRMRTLPAENQDDLPPLLLAKHDGYTAPVTYALIVLAGILISSFDSYADASYCRSVVEVLIPVLFSDWVLELTRPRKSASSAQNAAQGTPDGSNNNTEHNVIERFFRTDAMKFMGKISMSFYMLHVLVLFYVGLISYHEREDNESMVVDEQKKTRVAIWLIPVVLIVALLLGALFTFYVELPLHDWILARFLPPRGGKGDKGKEGGQEQDTEKGVSDKTLPPTRSTTATSLTPAYSTGSEASTPRDTSANGNSSNNVHTARAPASKPTHNPLNVRLLDEVFPI